MAKTHFHSETILYLMSSKENDMNLNFRETIPLQSMGLKLKKVKNKLPRKKFSWKIFM